jgi:hypothetical protein
MEEQRQVGRRRRGVVAAILAAGALAVVLPASGALAGDSESPASDAGSTPVQNDRAPRDRDCPSDHGGRDDAPAPEGSIEL